MATPMQYGKCYTDHKDGKNIRPFYRDADYVLGKEAVAGVEDALMRLGLPFPEPEEIFRGTHHDLLFLDSHGVVLRIGPTDVERLINPGVLQPLGWLTDVARVDDEPISIVIYPGIEHYEDAHVIDSHRVSGLIEFLERSNHNAADVSKINTGIIRISREGQEYGVPVVLDTDSYMTGARDMSPYFRRGHLHERSGQGDFMPGVLKEIMHSTSPISVLGRDLLAAFEVHQPLRQMFWRAWREDDGRSREKPDEGYMAAFWQRCAAAVKRAERVLMHGWSVHVNECGVRAERHEETLIENMGLYRAWTGAGCDRVPKFSGMRSKWTDILCAVVQKADGQYEIPVELRDNRQFMRTAIALNNAARAVMAPALADDKDYLMALPLKPVDIVQCASPRLRDDETFIKQMAEKDLAVLRHASGRVRADRGLASWAIREDVSAAPHIAPQFLDDAEFAREHIRAVPLLYKFLTPKLRADRDLALEAVSRKPVMLRFAGRLVDDDEIASAAVRNDGRQYSFVSGRLKKDPGLALCAIKADLSMYGETHKDLRAQREFRLAAVEARADVFLRYLPPEEREDRDFVRAFVRSAPDRFNGLDAHWRRDPEIVTECLKRAPDKAPAMDSPLMSDGEFLLGMVAQRVLRVRELPREWMRDAEFMWRAAQLPGVMREEIPRNMQENAVFKARMRGELPPEHPVIEHNGLKYIWINNARAESMSETDAGVRVDNGEGRLVVRDTVVGPAKGAAPGMAGIYRLYDLRK